MARRTRIADMSLNGDDLGKRFVLQFTGMSHTASKRAQKAQDLLRNPDKSWKKFNVTSPGNRQTEIFVSRDKNGRQIRTEISTRRMRDAIHAAHPNLNLFVNKQQGTVSDGWTPLVKVEPHPDEPVTIRWHTPAIEARNFDKDAIVLAFKASDARSADDVTWDL